jgi:hypothetical protein
MRGSQLASTVLLVARASTEPAKTARLGNSQILQRLCVLHVKATLCHGTGLPALDAFQANSRTRPCTGAQTACPPTQSATHVPRVRTVQAVLLAWRCRCTQNLPLPHRITRAKQVSYTHSLPQCVLESLMKFQRIAQAMPQRYLLHVAAMPERYAQCAAV